VSSTPLVLLGAIVLGAVIFALLCVRRVSMTPQEYVVGGRGFGTIFLWVLLGGEIYTSFTFLGAAGWAYGFGAPAYYIIAYGAIGYAIGYFLLPSLWRFGKANDLLTAPDLLRARYGSQSLEIMSAIVHVVAVIPYVTLQLSALQIFLTFAGRGKVDPQTGAILSFLVILAFVFITGLRGTAWVSIVKDVLVIGALLFVGVAIPIRFFGSPAAMFDQLIRLHPEHLILGAATSSKGTIWYLSTVLLTGTGFFMGPQSVAATFSARDEGALRRNAALLPFYQALFPLVFFAGFTALLIVPGLKGPQVDQSFLSVIVRYYPPWVLGVVTAAGTLCALVPSTALLLGAGSIVSKNLVGDRFGLAPSDNRRVLTTRILVLFIGLLALLLWLTYKTTLVSLLLLYYNGVSQFAPAIMLGFTWKRTNLWGASAGIIVGIVVALYLAATNTSPWGCNPGFIGLVLNTALVIVVSLATQKTEEPAMTTGS
jgi:solute:Na+ symporter, SSS family